MHQELGATEILANLSIGYIVFAAFILTVVRLALTPSRGAIARSITELVESLIIAGVLVFMIIRPFFLQAFYIPSESMEPTLMGHNVGYGASNTRYDDAIHDHIFVNKLIYRLREPRRGDIIVFRAEKKADRSAESDSQRVENVLIKRLIGIPGDKIEVKPDAEGKIRVFVNDVAQIEPVAEPDRSCKQGPHCINEEMYDAAQRGATFGVTDHPIKLASGQLFVMGDNRNNSNDSRYWGPLPRDRVIGKAELIFWPLNRIRLIH